MGADKKCPKSGGNNPKMYFVFVAHWFIKCTQEYKLYYRLDPFLLVKKMFEATTSFSQHKA